MSSNEEVEDLINKFQKEHTTDVKPVSRKEYLRIIGPSIGWIGVSIAWSLQTGYGTPYLLSLGLKESNVNYVWLAGPITGMIAQPLVGSISDKLQNRTPFIMIGAITVFIMLIIFSNAQFISNRYGLIITIVAFWINDFFISVLMAPLRVLASDTISSSKQIDAMSWFSIFGSLGSMIAFGFGSLISNVSILYLIGALFILFTCIVTLKIVRSSRSIFGNSNADIPHQTINYNNLCWNGFINIFIGIKNCPLYVWKLMLTQFFAFAAFLPFWIYVTHFYGENIMKGAVNADDNEQYKLYQQGVKYGNLAFCMQGFVRMIASYLVPKYFMDGKKKRIKIFWMMSYCVYGIFGCMTPWIDNLVLFIALHSLSGIAMVSMYIFPWTLASKYAIEYEPQNAGLILSILNISVCIPQIIVALIGGGIIQFFQNDVSSILFFGGMLGFAAAVSVYFVDIEYKGKKSKFNALQQININIELEQ